MVTIEQRLAALETLLSGPSGYYTSKYSGEEIDALLALTGYASGNTNLNNLVHVISSAQASTENSAGAAAVSAASAANSAASAANSAAWAAGSAASAKQMRDSIDVDYAAMGQIVSAAKAEVAKAENNAALSKSWAAGGTGSRVNEDADNAKFWAGKAQAEADRATVPPVEGVYNIILSDRVTNDRYALIVEGGTLKLLGVANTLDGGAPRLIDTVTGIAYELISESGALKLLEVN